MQLSACQHHVNMKYQTYSSIYLFLFFTAFLSFYVNMLAGRVLTAALTSCVLCTNTLKSEKSPALVQTQQQQYKTQHDLWP